MENDKQLVFSLFALRGTVALVMLVWNLDKFINPGHAAKVYESFYFLGGLDSGIMYAIGAVEIVIVAAFLFGFMKRFSYATVLVLHAISTFHPTSSIWRLTTVPTSCFLQPGRCRRPASPSICCGIETFSFRLADKRQLENDRERSLCLKQTSA